LLDKSTEMKIAIGNDHAGTEYKNTIVNQLRSDGYEVMNFGTDTNDSVDYPDFIHPVAKVVANNEVDFGIIICGSGNGASMTANKHQNVRSALCWTNEIAVLARQHNNANILSIPARFTSEYQALDMVNSFLNTEFEGGRHQLRVKKIPCI
jgi:ribose 5-phosphate isomerase B